MMSAGCRCRFFAVQFFFIFFALLACSRDVPKIISINPQIEMTGNLLTIHGENFGDERNESFVRFGSVTPTLSSYHLWSDTTIIVRIPDFGESGLIYVQRNNKKSNAILFSTQEYMPVFPAQPESSAPLITSIEPENSAVGSLVTLSGRNFGSGAEGGAVQFTWGVEKSSRARAGSNDLDFLRAGAESGDYLSWNENEIQVYVPDGAVTGGIEVVTKSGGSNKAPITISSAPGVKIIKDKKTFTISYSVNFRVGQGSPPNALFFALPTPVDSAFQRNRDLLSHNGTPFADKYRGVRLYKFSDLQNKTANEVSVSYLVDVYAIETTIEANQVSAVQSSSVRRYQAGGADIGDAIKVEAAALVGRETNPYLKARSIYRAMLKEAGGDSFVHSARFASLCSAVDVPCISVAGVLVIKNTMTAPHLWNMFWIDRIGWIPVDIALAKGIAPDGFNLNETVDYYFGNIDNNRIVFSFGQTILPPMSFDGRTSSRPHEYALQNIWEESSGSLESYSSSWSTIEITGVY
ncbi:MAG: IPT/TIG domain-containing protein [Spirochaetaceae bacterium]|jgi:hypothetical protein|nr:IPT/TIG domain-containing protein [Spirochaetaceae bacterium]